MRTQFIQCCSFQVYERVLNKSITISGLSEHPDGEPDKPGEVLRGLRITLGKLRHNTP